jgi:hypothetical protein
MEVGEEKMNAIMARGMANWAMPLSMAAIPSARPRALADRA